MYHKVALTEVAAFVYGIWNSTREERSEATFCLWRKHYNRGLCLDSIESPKDKEVAIDEECTEPPPAKRMKSTSSEIPSDGEDPEVFDDHSKDDLRNITVDLEGKELWERFSELGTEMIITKAGRWVSLQLFQRILACSLDSREKASAFSAVLDVLQSSKASCIPAPTANKSPPEVQVVKKIRRCFVNTVFCLLHKPKQCSYEMGHSRKQTTQRKVLIWHPITNEKRTLILMP